MILTGSVQDSNKTLTKSMQEFVGLFASLWRKFLADLDKILLCNFGKHLVYSVYLGNP